MTDEPDLSGLERVERRNNGSDTPDAPLVSVLDGGSKLNFLKHAYAELGRPSYISFYKSGSKVFIVPSDTKQGVTNPHKIHCAEYTTLTSFNWYGTDTTGRAPLKYDDERNVHYFDVDDIGTAD